MADNSAAGFGKDPLVTSHGDALADQSFQSLKSKEIRDSLSPTEMRFQSMTLNNPNTTGWNVQSAKEVSPDGKGFRAETVATTDGVESVNGGIAEFKGRNEHRSSAHHEGDDKNFVKKAMESSNSHLQEKVVIGDENSGRTEVRTSSTKSSSSSQVIQSSTNVEYENGYPIQQQPSQPQKYIMDANRLSQQDFQQRQQQEQQRLREEQRLYEQQFQQQRQQNLNLHEQHTTEQVSKKHQSTQQKNISENIHTQETHEQNKRYVDMDKASPEYQQHVQHLMQQPGEVISNTVEYPKPNVKMITTVKRLPDGTIVRNKRYETEEVTPTAPSTRSPSTPLNQTQPRHDSHQQAPSRNYQPDAVPHAKPTHDMVDSGSTSRYVQNTHTDDVETKFSSIKKSSKKFSTETTSETIQEFDEHHPTSGPSARPKPKTDDFSTHGFPSVRADKPTQEYLSERPHPAYPAHSTPSKPNAAVVPRYTDDTDNISERRVQTKDGEVIIVSSEKKRNYKTSTNSERIVETEHIRHDDQPHQHTPAVREPRMQPSERQMQPHEQDFPLDKLPPGTRIINNQRIPHGEEEVVVVSSQKSHTAKHSSNVERIIEHDIIRDDQTGNYPRIQPNQNNSGSPYNYTITTPGEQIPKAGQPGFPNKPPHVDYSSQEVPAHRTPETPHFEERKTYYEHPEETGVKPASTDYSIHGYPSVSAPSRPAAGLPSSHRQHPSSPKKTPSQDYSTQGFPSVRTPSKTTPTKGYPTPTDEARPEGTSEQPYASPNKKTPSRNPSPNKSKTTNTTTRETTERVIKKEKEVDSAHRAFAASLRSSSPFDHTDYHHTRQTPRSSVSSTRTFRRDMREGSHESAPSEASRFSTTTITRNTPPRVVGGRTVVTKTVTTKTGPGSIDSLNATSPRATKSPSPGKISSVTTTTTRTLTSKDVPKVTEKSPTKKPSSQPAPSSKSSITTTTSISSRKPPTSVMTDDYDDDNVNKPSPFSSPSSRSRTPQKNVPTQVNDKPPQDDDWLVPRQPDNDERRTVQSVTTLDKPNFEPNVEWVIVDNDDYPDSDSDGFVPEVVDAKVDVKKTTTKLITQEKQISTPAQKKTQPRSITSRQLPATPTKIQTKTQDKSPLKARPSYDSKTPTPTKPNKPLTPMKTPLQTAPKTPSKILSNKAVTKGPTASSPAAPLGKSLTKSVTTSKTSQVLSEKTSKFIEREKLKEHKTKPQTPEKPRKPKDIAQEKPFLQREPARLPQKSEMIEITVNQPYTHSPQGVCYEPQVPSVNSDLNKPQEEDIFLTPQPDSPEFENKPNSFTPGAEKPQKVPAVHKPSPSPGFQKLQMTFGSPNPAQDDEPYQPCVEGQKPQRLFEEHVLIEETSQYPKPNQLKQQPNQKVPSHVRPSEHEAYFVQLHSKKPEENIQEDDVFISETYHQKVTGKPIPANKPTADKPSSLKPELEFLATDDDEEYPTDNKKPIVTSQKTVAKHIQKFETNFYKINQPKPQKGPKAPSKQPLHAPKKLTQPPEKLYKRVTTTEEPSDTEDDQEFENTAEFVVNSKQNCVISEEKTMPETPGTPGTRTSQRVISPARKQPEEPYSRRPQSPHKQVTPNRAQSAHKEPKDTSPSRIQNKPGEPYGRRPQSPNKQVSPKRDQPDQKEPKESSPTRIQRKPEEPYGRRPQSPEKCISPNRVQPGQKEPKETSPSRIQRKPEEPYGKRSQSPDKQFSPNRAQFVHKEPKDTSPSRIQNKPEEPYGRRPQSPNKQASPKRAQPGQKEPKETSPSRIQRKPEELYGRRPQSPEKQVLPNRAQPGQSEPKETSPTRTQKQPVEPYSRRSQSPDKQFSPNRAQPGQKEPIRKRAEEVSPDKPAKIPNSPEKSVDGRPQLPSKHSQETTNENEVFIVSLETTKVSKEKTIQESHNQFPIEYPKGHKPNEEILLEISEFGNDTSQKRLITEKPINKFEKTLQPRRKSPEKVTKLPIREGSPTKGQDIPEKRAPFAHKQITPTGVQNKPAPKNLEPAPKIKGPQHYPEQTTATFEEDDDTVMETTECTINLVQKQNITEERFLQFKDKPQKDSKSPVKSTSPTRSQTKDLKQQPDGEPSELDRSLSPNKPTSPARTQKKPDEVKRLVKEFITQEERNEHKKSPKPEKDTKFPTRESVSKRPQSPQKTWSPTRNSQTLIENEKRFETNLTINKTTVTEKSKKPEPDQQYPNQTKSKEVARFEKPSNEERDEPLTAYQVTEKQFQEPKYPATVSKPELTGDKPQSSFIDSKLSQIKVTNDFNQEVATTEEYSVFEEVSKPELKSKHLKPHSKDTLLKENTYAVKQKLVEEFDRPNKPRGDDTNHQKLPEEPKTSRFPKQTSQPEQKTPGYEEIMPTNNKTHKNIHQETVDNKRKELPDQPQTSLDKEENKTYSKTMEITFRTSPKKPQDNKGAVVHTSEFTRNTSQKFIESQQNSSVNESDYYFTDSGETPRPTSGPNRPKSEKPSCENQKPDTSFKTENPKSIKEDDTIFRKTLRKVDKPYNVESSDTDEELQVSESEDLLIETCVSSYVVDKNFITAEEQIKFSQISVKPKEPESSGCPEAPNRPKLQPFTATLEPWPPTETKESTTDLNEQVIKSERDRKETPDGAFVSKTSEPSATPTSPTFRKKGAGRSDTFEERCRQILGMENYGDTQGTFRKEPLTEVKPDNPENETINTTVFQVKIEDCDEEDEPLSITSVKKTIRKKTNIKEEPVKEEPKRTSEIKEPANKTNLTSSPEVYTTDVETPTNLPKSENETVLPNKPRSKSPKERTRPNEISEYEQISTETIEILGKALNEKSELQQKPKQPDCEDLSDIDEPQDDHNRGYEQTIIETTKTTKKTVPGEENRPLDKHPKYATEPKKENQNGFEQVITETVTVLKKGVKNKPDETEPDSSEPETNEVEFKKKTKSGTENISKKSSTLTTPRSSSHIKSSSSPRSESPTKTSSSPRSSSPIKTSSSPRSVSPTKSGISPRSESPTKSSSSPRSTSPTKPTSSKNTPQRKQSKNLLEPKSNVRPQPLDEDLTTIKDRLRSSTRKQKSPEKPDQVDGSDTSPERSPTRYTERRRSSNISVTTEIIIEHTDADTPHKKEKSPGIARKPQDSVYKEIIDSTVLPEKLTRRMQVTERKESAPVHRVTNKEKDTKMSRSTSENLIKIKKTEPQILSPGKATEHRSRPNKCFATKSINLSATDRLFKSEDMENVVIDIQHAKSSREPSPDKIVPTPVPAHLDTGKPRYPDVVQEPEDEQPRRKPQIKNIPIFEEESNAYLGCHITEINQTERLQKSSFDSFDYEENILKNPVVEAPPSLDYVSLEQTSEDESLLTVPEKVNKFQNITENVNKSAAKKADNTSYAPVKLAASAPQKSPELVRTISRHISRYSEPENGKNIEVTEDFPLTSQNTENEECCFVDNKKSTKEFKVSHHEQLTTETTIKTAEKYQQPEEYVNDHQHDDDEDDDDDDDDELIPHTATHTTVIEERRQKDILSRPSVFESRNRKQPSTTTTAAMKTPPKCNKSPVKDSEKLRPDNKSRIKPTSSAVTNITTEQTLANTKTPTPTTTAAAHTSTTFNKPKQLPQHKNSDIDYEFRGSNVQTGVKNIISKQTKVYNTNSNSNNHNNTASTSSDSKTNDLKKPTTTTSNQKPAQHMPVRLTPSQNTDEHDLSADDSEMIVTDEGEAPAAIDIETQVVAPPEPSKATASKSIPLRQPQTTEHSSTNSSSGTATERPKITEQKDHHVVKLTDNKLLESNTVTSTTSCKKTYEETLETADDIDETVLETTTKKTPTQTKTPKMSTTTTTTADSVAARRSLFENNSASPKRTPLASPIGGRRPSYMDHTKSSLEHTRKDSLEINKTNYSRKPSQPDEEEINGSGRNSLVKFDVPHSKRTAAVRAASITEDINVEEIFDLEILEKLLETVQSYEIRRRIRAQIRLIKKNQKNESISNSVTEVTTKAKKPTKEESEEPDTVSTTTRKVKPEEKSCSPQTQAKETPSQTSSSKKEYIFEETYHPTTRRSPRVSRYPTNETEAEQKSRKCSRSKEHERHYSPDKQKGTELVKVQEHSFTSEQHFYERQEQHEHAEEILEVRKETSPLRKPYSANSSPERRHASPESHKPLRDNKERSRSPPEKPFTSKRETSSRSPDNKTTRKSSSGYEQQQPLDKHSSTKRITSVTKTKHEDKTPVWADRKNVLKTPSSGAPKKPNSAALDSRASGYTKTVKSSSTTSQKMTANKSSSFIDDDCVTSSYGIGPTDENGLPLFGIRALKKKKPAVEPSETTEVTGYVVEEKYYSNNKTKPTLERKELIYSTNPEELEKLKEQVEITSKRTSLKDVDIKESREAALISKATPALRSSPEDDFLDSTSKYVRRGSVKEMSEKFIQKEAATSVTEKTNNYPKAGLILRTNSRKSSRDMENENENDNFETIRTTRIQQHSSSALADSDDNQYEYEVEEVESRHSGRFITESESECDSIKTQREFKKVTSSSSSSMATRSFLNSQGEEKVVTNVSDCLERMRNADNVVEEGDSAEDQEARALLNKFLGASIIMKGVESSLPAANRQSNRIITTTTTSSNLNDDNDGDNNAKHEVKTTRITKTITSGSSSAPVTCTTCDIEEIWDEEILKELLEQARTYEERRKIRSRLRELMADREEQKQPQKSTSSTTEKTETKEEDGAVVTTTTKVTTRTVTGSAAKPVTPFAKFKQLDKQSSQQTAKSPTTPTTTGGGSTASASSGNQPIFKFTDPALNAKAATVKEQLLQWCQSKTQEYENIEITNFSTSWNNGLAFCALIHHFLPDAFDYSQLTPKNRRKNFELAFTVADEKAGIAPLLDVEDMVVMQRPDWKCVFVYVQSIYRRFRNCQ